MKKMKNFDLEKFKNYVNTYDKQVGHEDYEIYTILEDFLYGIGICIDEDKYRCSDGFKKFKEVLVKHLDAVSKKELPKKCWCGNPVDQGNPDCVTFNLCRDHASDA
jgi:hypothetical protein